MRSLEGAGTRYETCDQADRQGLRRVKLAERGSQIAVVTGVPIEECPACGERWTAPTVADLLDALPRRLIASGAQTAIAAWDAAAAPTAPRAGHTARDWKAR